MPFGAVIGGALGLAGSLFGDDSEDVAEANVEASRPQYPEIAEPYVSDLFTDAQSLYNQGLFAPGPTELELAGRENYLGYGEEALPELVGATQTAWLDALDPSINPYATSLVQAAQNDLIQDYQRNVLPSIADDALTTGGYGGSRQGVAEGIASEGLMESLADVEASILSDAYQDALAQQASAFNVAGNMLGYGFLPSQTQMEVGQMYTADAGLPAANLYGYSGLIQPYSATAPGPQSAYTSGTDPFSSTLGGALAGSQVGQTYDWFGSSGSSGDVNWSDPNIDPFSYM